MKTKSAIKRLCKHCKIVKRRGRNFVICKKNPRHKQRQGYHTAAAAAQTPEVATFDSTALPLLSVNASFPVNSNGFSLTDSNSVNGSYVVATTKTSPPSQQLAVSSLIGLLPLSLA